MTPSVLWSVLAPLAVVAVVVLIGAVHAEMGFWSAVVGTVVVTRLPW